jgi:phage terminase large subunit-like protein
MGPNDYLVGGVELDLSLLDEEFGPAEAPVELAREMVAPQTIDTTSSLIEAVRLSKKIEELQKYVGYDRWFVPGTQMGIDKLPKHKAFMDCTGKYRQIYLSGANRCGKTLTASWLTARHLTGEYPDWYEGKRFKKPIQAWAAGDFNHTTRDIIQQSLMGNLGEFGTGMIPRDKIVNHTAKSGVSGGIDKLYVRHVSGGLSCLQFKAYKQSNESFYGTAMDWIWLDELPGEAIFSECFTRTMTTGGIVCVTATPLAGMTPLVFSFYSEADFLPDGFQLPNTVRMAKEDLARKNEESRQRGEQVVKTESKKVVVCIGWDDAPWLSEEEKIEQLASTPAYLRQAKSTGVPGDTGGAVFPIAMSELLVDDFPIPAHYKLINGLDPGWHNTGALFGALDPDTDTLYIYADYKRGQTEIVVHAEAIKTKSKWADAPVIYDYAGMGGKAEEESTRTLYRKHGLKLINAEKAVMAGIAAVWERMSTGKLKIFKSCRTLQNELVTYRFDEKGNIIKENDHCVDVLKYLVMGIKHARTSNQSATSSFGSLKGQVGGKKYWS